ncbi:MAG: tRNA pseudouridine(38-40) synthase TruA [Bacteroidota bacterium]
MRYFIRMAFNGAAYHGWQAQDNAATVQQAVEGALSMLFRNHLPVVGAGRTDTGVHAKEYFAHVEIENELSPAELQKITFKLNGILPDDIVIYEVYAVAPDMHARFSALSRTYKYYISPERNPFAREYSWFYPGRLDIERMNKGAALLMECTDFTSFAKVHSDTKTNNCAIAEAGWQYEDGMLVFTITADRFLRNMVRAIVGTLVELGAGKINLNDLQKIVESKNRSEAGYSVPAQALFLERVEYPSELKNFK